MKMLSLIMQNPFFREQVYHFGLAMPKEALVSNVTIKSAQNTESLTTATLRASEFMAKILNTNKNASIDNQNSSSNATDKSDPDAPDNR